MESLPKDTYLKFNPDTFINVRKEFNLENERMVEAINILEDWAKKQNHFTKRDFGREYLERTLITTKGQVERAKTRIDNLCTFKTLMPNFFEDVDIRNCSLSDILYHAPLPKLTQDNNRIYAALLIRDNINTSHIMDFYKYTVIMSEYLVVHDYCKGYINVIDLRDVNIVNLATKFNPITLRQALTVLMDGYGLRLSAIHLITPSKMVDVFVNLLKQVLSAKVSNRIHVHKNLDSLYEFLPKDILPHEFDGKERSLKQLQEEWLGALGSEEHKEYLKEINKATTNESLRQLGKFNEQYLGLPGSFRSLNVD